MTTFLANPTSEKGAIMAKFGVKNVDFGAATGANAARVLDESAAKILGESAAQISAKLAPNSNLIDNARKSANFTPNINPALNSNLASLARCFAARVARGFLFLFLRTFVFAAKTRANVMPNPAPNPVSNSNLASLARVLAGFLPLRMARTARVVRTARAVRTSLTARVVRTARARFFTNSPAKFPAAAALFATIFALATPQSVHAAASKTSPIPPAQIEFVNLAEQACFAGCQRAFVERGELASFAAGYDAGSTTGELSELFAQLASGEKSAAAVDLRLAVLVPERTIGAFAKTISKTLLAFAASRGLESEIRFYHTRNENSGSLIAAVRAAVADGFGVVLAPLTEQGVAVLAREEFAGVRFFVPTISRDVAAANGIVEAESAAWGAGANVAGANGANGVANSNFAANAENFAADSATSKNANFIFGGVSYAEQIAALLTYSTKKIAAINNNDSVAARMHASLGALVGREIYNITLDGERVRLGAVIAGNAHFKDASIFLNTPVHKTSVVAAQLRSYGFGGSWLFSTQINYNPAIVADTQSKDIQHLLIANSLAPILSDELAAKSALLGVDLHFERVAYGTALGADYIHDAFFNGEQRSFSQAVRGGAVRYGVEMMEASEYGFTPSKRKPQNAVQIVGAASAVGFGGVGGAAGANSNLGGGAYNNNVSAAAGVAKSGAVGSAGAKVAANSGAASGANMAANSAKNSAAKNAVKTATKSAVNSAKPAQQGRSERHIFR